VVLEPGRSAACGIGIGSGPCGRESQSMRHGGRIRQRGTCGRRLGNARHAAHRSTGREHPNEKNEDLRGAHDVPRPRAVHTSTRTGPPPRPEHPLVNAPSIRVPRGFPGSRRAWKRGGAPHRATSRPQESVDRANGHITKSPQRSPSRRKDSWAPESQHREPADSSLFPRGRPGSGERPGSTRPPPSGPGHPPRELGDRGERRREPKATRARAGRPSWRSAPASPPIALAMPNPSKTRVHVARRIQNRCACL